MKSTLVKIPYVALLAALVTGCSGVDLEETVTETVGLEDYSIEYKKSKQVDTLELPPDLSSSRIEDSMVVPGGGSASYSDLNRQGSGASRGPGVLPEQKDIRVERDGNSRWLVVNAPAEQVWGKVREFWVDMGFLLTAENPQVGIMETDWKENRADIPNDFIREFLSTVLESAYSAPTRDSFRARIEAGDSPDQTEIFISHRGVLEKVSGESTVWETRPAEPELEAEMLRRLMIFMGTEDAKARARLAKTSQGVIRARLIKDREGNALVDYRAGFPRAWRIVGLALDRVGFTVEDRDRSKGIYYVRYSDPLKDMQSEEKGLLSSLVFWGDDDKPSEEEYQVALSGDEASTQITVQDKNGQRDKSKTSGRILTLLYEQIK
ncbi:MAG: outer membrane protein assembly factor BamC [Gammaproteobacteria bacterium]|nr:outer membrane protein assembly factor BamC [Gammaproteobacteria bacterium]